MDSVDLDIRQVGNRLCGMDWFIDPFKEQMVKIPAGSFEMGSNGGESDEKPVHTVNLSGFSISKYEVTQAQWREIMGTNPSYFKNCDNCPVETVSWDNIEDFLKKLNEKTGKTYRLPTEAEWEYAAKANQNTKYSGSDDLETVAWYNENSDNETHPVGKKAANAWGLYDMSGNVWEWCSDWYGAYSSGSQSNPTGATSGTDRVLRGGSWNDNPVYCRVAYRYDFPGDRDLRYGFRLVSVP